MRPSRISTTLAALALAIALAASSDPAGAQTAGAKDTAPTTRLLDLALRSPAEKRGDYDALAASLLEALPALAGDFRVELITTRLGRILPWLRDPLALRDAVVAASEGPELDGWTRTALRDLAASLHRRAGEPARALELERQSGHLRDWWAIGPFGKGLTVSLREPFPPEREQRLDAEHPAGWQTLGWQRVALPAPLSSVDPAAHLWPPSGVFYFVTQVRVDAPTAAVLERSSSRDLRLWLGGVLTVDDEVDEQWITSPRRTRVQLAQGWNRILVKTTSSFRLRLTSPTGDPLLDAVASAAAESELQPLRAAAASSPPEQPAATLARWRDAALGADANPVDAAGLALLALYRGRDDLAVEAIERALERAPDDAALQYHAGSVFRYARYLPTAESRNRALGAFARATELDPEFVPAYERLARYLETDDKHAEAAAKVDEAITRQPTFLRGILRLAATYDKAGWEALRLETLRRIETIAPGSTLPSIARAGRYEALGHPRAAIAEYEKALAIDGLRLDLLGALARLHSATGDSETAESLLEKWTVAAPHDNRARRELAAFLERQERWEEALEVRRELAAEKPRDPDRLLIVANLLERLGRRGEALAAYADVLALEPGRPALTRYLERETASEPPRPFWEPYDEDVADWGARIPETGGLVEKANSIAILDITVVRIAADGSASEYTHQAFRLLTEESIAELAKVQVPGEVVTLRTIQASGETLEPVPATGKREFDMPGLKAGATIDYAYRVDRAHRRGGRYAGTRFYFQDPQYRQSFLLSRLVTILEPGATTEIEETRLDVTTDGDGSPQFARVERTDRELEDGTRVVVFEARSVPRLQTEPLQPTAAEYVPNVRVSGRASWDEVVEQLRRRTEGRTRLTAELRRVAEEVAGSSEDPLEKARALFAHVDTAIPSSRGPRDAAGVLLAKAGDRTVLFKALLEAAGVPSDWAWIRPLEASQPRVNWRFPSAGFFASSPFVVVRDSAGESHWVSLASRGVPFGLLPEVMRGGTALVVTADGSRLERIPGLDPREAATSFVVRAKLGEGLGGDVSLQLISRSLTARAQKDRFRTVQGFQKNFALQGIANQIYPGARLSRGEFTGLDDRDAPFVIAVDIAVPRLLTPGDGVELFSPLPRPLALVRTFGGKTEREHPFCLRSPRIQSDEVTVELGDGHEVRELPRGVALVSALGTYSLSYRHDGRTIRVERHLELFPGRVEPDSYPALVEFFEAVDRAETESVVLERRS